MSKNLNEIVKHLYYPGYFLRLDFFNIDLSDLWAFEELYDEIDIYNTEHSSEDTGYTIDKNKNPLAKKIY